MTKRVSKRKPAVERFDYWSDEVEPMRVVGPEPRLRSGAKAAATAGWSARLASVTELAIRIDLIEWARPSDPSDFSYQSPHVAMPPGMEPSGEWTLVRMPWESILIRQPFAAVMSAMGVEFNG